MEKQKNKAAVHLGRLAAEKNKAKGSAYFSELGKKSAAKRWGKKVSTDSIAE